jgi:hypothetical protein
MDPSIGAHEGIPMLYRSILMLLAELERQPDHDEAKRIRNEALRAYARAWDAESKERLERLEARLVRRLADGPVARPWWRLS